MVNIFLFIAGIFLFTWFFGRWLEKIHVPWLFSALIFGVALAIYNPFEEITSSDTFQFLAQLGMYFLLFLIGFELDLSKFKDQTKFILKSAFFIIFLEGLLGSLIVHFVFDYDWLVSILVALSFATVGEGILVPILDRFKLINTHLGQSIIGIGTIDDIIEVATLILAGFLVGAQSEANILLMILALAGLIALSILFRFFGKEKEGFKVISIETLFLFILFVLFLFLGIGTLAEAQALAALLAGIVVRVFIQDERLAFIESEVKSLAYGLFAPLFFVWVGSVLNIEYLLTFPALIALVVIVSAGGKLLASFIIGRKYLGYKGSMLLGIGLSTKFSTSLVIIKFLLDDKIVNFDIYSVIVASNIIFAFIIPILFSQLISRWRSDVIYAS